MPSPTKLFDLPQCQYDINANIGDDGVVWGVEECRTCDGEDNESPLEHI